MIDQRLRAPAIRRPFFVILVEPEIPPNTGNIARLCAGTGCPLHLVGKLGFRIDEHAVRRAGLDYWHLVEVKHHPDLPACLGALDLESGLADGSGRTFYLSAHAERSIFDVHFQLGDRFVFGRESVGLDRELLDAHPTQVVGIPTLGPIRSLNLANAVAVVLYEALRQTDRLRVRGREVI